MEILISDRQSIEVDKGLVKELSLFVLAKEKASDESELSVSLVNEQEIWDLNKNYRQIDKPTDVLSFSFNENENTNDDPILGDVILCISEVEKRAKKYDTTFGDYFPLLIVHSILHLLGYSHESDEHAKVMVNRENQLLEEFSVESKSLK